MSTFQRNSAISFPPSLPLTQNTAPVKEFKCLYSHDKRQKKKRWHDGLLRYHTFNKRVMVYDDARNFIGDMHYTDSGEICEGDDLVFEAFLVQVSECTKTLQQDLAPLFSPKLRRREAIHRETSASAGRIPTLRTPTQAGLFQSRVQRGPPQAMTPQTPLSQLKAKSLNALLGAAKGPQGRALLPALSPFEERQQKLNDTRMDGHPLKRQKRNVPVTKNDSNDMDNHIIPAEQERAGPVEVRDGPLWHRTASRWEQQNGDKEGSSDVCQQPAPRLKEVLREPQTRGSPSNSKSVLEVTKQQIGSPAISIESDFEPMEGPYKPSTGCGRNGPTKSPKAYKEKTSLVYEKYPLQPLRILATHSSCKTKLLCQEGPPKPSKREIDSRTRLGRQQQARLQEQLQKQHCTQTNIHLSDLSQPEKRPDTSYGAKDASERREKRDLAPLCSSPQAGRKRHKGVGRVGPLPEHVRMSQHLLATEKAISSPTLIRTPKGESRFNPQKSFGQSARSRQERKRKLSQQNNTDLQPASRIPKSATHAFTMCDDGCGDAVVGGPGGPWSKEAVELFDWHPPSMKRKNVGTSLFVSQG